MTRFIYVSLNKQLSKHNGEAGALRRHRARYDVTVMVVYHSSYNTGLIKLYWWNQIITLLEM